MKSNCFRYFFIFLVLCAVFGLNFVLCIGPHCLVCRRKVTEENESIPFQCQFKITMDYWLFYLVSILLVDFLGHLVYCCAVSCSQLARDIIGNMRNKSSVKGLQRQNEKKRNCL